MGEWPKYVFPMVSHISYISNVWVIFASIMPGDFQKKLDNLCLSCFLHSHLSTYVMLRNDHGSLSFICYLLMDFCRFQIAPSCVCVRIMYAICTKFQASHEAIYEI